MMLVMTVQTPRMTATMPFHTATAAVLIPFQTALNTPATAPMIPFTTLMALVMILTMPSHTPLANLEMPPHTLLNTPATEENTPLRKLNTPTTPLMTVV